MRPTHPGKRRFIWNPHPWLIAGTPSGYRVRAPKGQPVKARGETPRITPPKGLCALKGHTEQGSCGHRSPRWGEVAWGGVTQGSAPLHPSIAVRRVAARAGAG
jgi:hypothetical protein